MQLTRYADYSLRTLIYLALTPNNVTVSDIAERYDISRNHLVKVVHNLGKLGYINTARGRSGGISLAIKPKDINVGQVIRQVEPNFDLVECFSEENNRCPLTSVCRLRGVLTEAHAAFIKVLDKYTLSDMVANEADLAMLLKLTPVATDA